jgi:hypothetical protein
MRRAALTSAFVDARTFLGMERTGETTWTFEVTERVITPGNFLFGGCGLASALSRSKRRARDRRSGRPPSTCRTLPSAPRHRETDLAVDRRTRDPGSCDDVRRRSRDTDRERRLRDWRAVRRLRGSRCPRSSHRKSVRSASCPSVSIARSSITSTPASRWVDLSNRSTGPPVARLGTVVTRARALRSLRGHARHLRGLRRGRTFSATRFFDNGPQPRQHDSSRDTRTDRVGTHRDPYARARRWLRPRHGLHVESIGDTAGHGQSVHRGESVGPVGPLGSNRWSARLVPLRGYSSVG